MAAASGISRLPYREFPPHLATIALASLAINILGAGLPIVSRQVYDRVLRDHNTATLTVLVVGICVVVVFDTFLRLARSYIIGENAASFVYRHTCSAMERMVSSRSFSLNESNLAEATEDLTAIRRMKEFHSGHATVALMDMVFLPLLLFLIYDIGGLVVLVPIVMLGLSAMVAWVTGHRLYQATGERLAADNTRYSFLIHILKSIHTVKALALEQSLSRRYETLQETSSRCYYSATRIGLSSYVSFAILSQLMTVMVVAISAYMVTLGQLTLGGVIAIVLLSGRILQPVQQAMQLWIQYQTYRQSEQQVRRLFGKTATQETETESPGDVSGTLSIQNLSFQYDPESAPVLDNISLTLEKGSIIALHGAPGAGKSSLLKLIAGMYHPTQGKLLVNNTDVTRYAPGQLMLHVGLIATRGVTFRGSIRDNVTRFGQIPYTQALEVANYLGIYKDIVKLPYGMDTALNDNLLDPITPGMKQMLAILRSLASKPRIILFDDADFALDQQNYDRVYKLLGSIKDHVSMIIVSRDANLRSLADLHYELKGGALIRCDAS